MGLRDEKKTATRNAILETSLTLFRSEGFERTRVQDVVRRLRISEATFFNYFPSKQSLLQAAADDLVSRSLDLLRDEVAEERGPVEERLRRLATEFASNFSGDRDLARLLAKHSGFLLVASDRARESRALLTRLFEEGQARGEVRDDVPAVQLCDIHLAASLVVITGWIDEGKPTQPLEDRLLAFHRVMWTGVQVQEHAPRRGRRRQRAAASS